MEFRYTALDDQGQEVAGTLQAESRVAALACLKGMGLFPTHLQTRDYPIPAQAPISETAALPVPASGPGVDSSRLPRPSPTPEEEAG
jgi:hypothetical protein